MPPEIKFRANALFLILIFALSLLCCRIAWMQVMQTEKYTALKEIQHTRKEFLVAQRGRILDANGLVLAQSIPVDSLFVVPGQVKDKAAVAAAVANLLQINEARLLKKLHDPKRKFSWVKRHLTSEQALQIKETIAVHDWAGFGFRQEYRRVYPQGRLASHMLGVADIDQNGLDGLERYYDDTLTGKDGFRVVHTDALRRGYITTQGEEHLPVPGQDIQLTVDVNIQQIVHEELAALAKEWKCESVSAVVIDPVTGAILALANLPDFDPNDPGASPAENRRNRALTDSFEPGSMNKPFIVSRALEYGLVTPDSKIYCEKGFWRYRARRIKDVHPYGTLEVRDVISKSSNIGTTKIGLKLQEYGLKQEKNPIRDTMLAVGFGRKSGIDLPGEENGKVTSLDRWSYHSDVSVCFGYEISVTPLQMTLAASLWANGGVLMKPYVVKSIHSPRGNVDKRGPMVTRRVYEPETMDTINIILQKVVEKGTARAAQLKEYRVAGKTGTTHKVQGGRYVKKYISSFVGYAPAENPRVIVLVTVNEPHGRSHYGGTVAGPTVGRIIDKFLRYKKIPGRNNNTVASPGYGRTGTR